MYGMGSTVLVPLGGGQGQAVSRPLRFPNFTLVVTGENDRQSRSAGCVGLAVWSVWRVCCFLHRSRMSGMLMLYVRLCSTWSDGVQDYGRWCM